MDDWFPLWLSLRVAVAATLLAGLQLGGRQASPGSRCRAGLFDCSLPAHASRFDVSVTGANGTTKHPACMSKRGAWSRPVAVPPGWRT